jgi:hypothetical protein
MRSNLHKCLLTLGALVLVAAFAGMVCAAAPPEAEVQGLYEGSGSDAGGQFKIEARVVAEGGGNYNVFIRQIRSPGNITRAELQGKTVGDAVTMSGRAGSVPWKAVYANHRLSGQCGEGSFKALRAHRQSPTLGKRAPAGAIVLLDGKNFSEMVQPSGAKWDIGKLSPGADGSIQIPRGGMNTKRTFPGSLDLHVEFMIPLMPAAHSQGRGNSGVFLPNRDEIQVLDSFGDTTYLGGGCGGAYAYKDPDVMETIDSLKGNPQCKFTLASLPPLCWQTYDIQYRLEAKDGKQVGKPRVTVYHNGIKIHDNFELRSPPNVPESPTGKLHFQDHGCPVRYRNIWVLPLDK